MIKRSILSALAAASIVAAPTAALAQSAPQIAPAEETVEGSELRGGFVLPGIVIVAFIIGLVLVLSEDESTDPIST